MRIKIYLGFFILAIMAVVIIGIAVFMLLMTSDIGRDLSMNELDFQGVEEDLSFDPTNGTDNGFVVNPYQSGNQDRSQALIIGTSVSYILKEIKSFIIFSVVLAILALIAYVVIAYIVLNRIARPAVKKEEPAKNEEHVNGDKEFNASIECLSSNAAILSLTIDEMLSNIDSIMEKSKVKWSVTL